MRPMAAVMFVVAALTAAPRGVAAQASPTSNPRDLNLTVYTDLLWSDVRAQKVALLTEMMALTEAQDAVFWPIYREYDLELTKLNDERVAMIREYAASYDSMTEALADTLGRKAIDINRRRAALLEAYYDRVKTALSPKVAVRFLQVEHQLLLIVDLQIASSLPVMK